MTRDNAAVPIPRRGRFGRMRIRRLPFAAVLLVATLTLALPCFAASAGAQSRIDPMERLNRAVFDLNARIESATLSLLAKADGLWSPRLLQPIDNALANLRQPIGAAAGLITGDVAGALNSTTRFAINSTLGLLGTKDVATRIGFPREQIDLGLELCRLGLLSGSPYLELPILGPSSASDLAAQVATNVALYWLIGNYFIPYFVVDRLDLYLRRLAMEAKQLTEPLDPYATNRDAYLDRRREGCAALSARFEPR